MRRTIDNKIVIIVWLTVLLAQAKFSQWRIWRRVDEMHRLAVEVAHEAKTLEGLVCFSVPPTKGTASDGE